jgi:D-sedoheptulose 7-phosphate isomerase
LFSEYIKVAGTELANSIALQMQNQKILKDLDLLFSLFCEAVRNKRVIYFFGNGGSAAEATHIAAEFTSFCIKKHKPWGAISLNESSSILTSIPNDFSFDQIFERQVEALVRQGDVVVGLSTSGKSENVLKGLKAAKLAGSSSVLLTSIKNNSLEYPYCDIVLRAQSNETTRIQEIHLHWLHSIIEYLEISDY